VHSLFCQIGAARLAVGYGEAAQLEVSVWPGVRAFESVGRFVMKGSTFEPLVVRL
jgi:hypothetical protein